MLEFAAAVFLLIFTPGPGVLSLAGVGSGFGYQAGIRYMIGLLAGNFLVSLAVISGLAAIIISVPIIRIILMTASFSYLAYLAYRIAFAGSDIALIKSARAPGLRDGIILQIINPKAYAVNTALFSGFAYAPNNLLFETITKLVILEPIWIAIHLIWLWVGVSIRRLDLPGETQRKINYAMAAALLGVVALAIWSAISAA